MSLTVKMLALAAGPSGVYSPGQQYDLPDSFARDLVSGRYAEPIGWVPQAKVPRAPLVSEAPLADESPPADKVPEVVPEPIVAEPAPLAEPPLPTITTGVLSGDEAAGLAVMVKATTETPVATPAPKPKAVPKAKPNGKAKSGKKSKGGR